MKIEGFAGQAHNAQSMPRQTTAGEAAPGTDDTGGDAAAPSVIVDITDAADQPLGVPGGRANSAAHRARAMIESFLAMGAEMGDLRFGQVVSRIARGLDASELFVLPEPLAEEEEASGPAAPLVEGEGEGEGDTPVVVVAPTPEPEPDIDPDLAVAALLLEEAAEEDGTPTILVEPPPAPEDASA